MKTITIPKKEENVAEHGIQLRTALPVSFLDKRLFLNKLDGKMYYESSTARRLLTLPIFTSDPVTYEANKPWINDTEGKVKYFDGVQIKEIVLTQAESETDFKDEAYYSGVLGKAELKAFVPTVSESNLIVEPYLTVTGNFVNVELKGSKLGLVDGQLSGSHVEEKRINSGANTAEGIVVITQQPLKIESVEETDNTHSTLVLKGDQTSTMIVGTRFGIFEKEDDKDYFLLNGDLKPAIFLTTDVTVIGNETHVTFSHQAELNFEMGGNGINLLPIKIDVKVGAQGVSGLLDSLAVEEIFNYSTVMKVYGDEVRNKISINYSVENITSFTANHSADKQNWMIIALATDIRWATVQTDGPYYHIFYSTDGLKTITKSEIQLRYDPNNIETASTTEGARGAITQTNFYLSPRLIKINNDGRFIFAVNNYPLRGSTGYHCHEGYYGHMKNGFWLKAFENGFDTVYPQKLTPSASASYFFTVDMAIDWDTGILATFTSNQTPSSVTYFLFYELDWNTRSIYTRGYKRFGSATEGVSAANQFVMPVELEGERQFIFGICNGTNDVFYLHKLAISIIQKYHPRGSVASFGNTSSSTYVATKQFIGLERVKLLDTTHIGGIVATVTNEGMTKAMFDKVLVGDLAYINGTVRAVKGKVTEAFTGGIGDTGFTYKVILSGIVPSGVIGTIYDATFDRTNPAITYSGLAFSNSDIGGVPDAEFLPETQPSIEFLGMIAGYRFRNQKLILNFMGGAVTTSPALSVPSLIRVIDFARTRKAIKPKYLLSFNDVSELYSLKVVNNNTLAEGTTSTLNKQFTEAQIKTILEGLAVIGSGNASISVYPYDGKTWVEIELNKSEPFTISLNSGTAVTITAVEVGQQPIYLKYPDKLLKKFTPLTGGLIAYAEKMKHDHNFDSHGYRDASETTRGALSNQARYNGDKVMLNTHVKDKTIYSMSNMAPRTATFIDGFQAHLIKVPDYETCIGVNYIESQDATVAWTSNSTTQQTKNHRRWKVRQGSHVPSGMYPSGKLPIRTMGVELCKNYNGGAGLETYVLYRMDYYLRIKVCELNVNGTGPDETQVIAVSTKYPMDMMPPYPDYGKVFFNFDNLELDIGKDVAFVMEIVDSQGNDVFPLTDDYFKTIGYYVTFRSCYDNMAGNYSGGFQYYNWSDLSAPIWETNGAGFWFETYDTYCIPVTWNHANGRNIATAPNRISYSDAAQKNTSQTFMSPKTNSDLDRSFQGFYTVVRQGFSATAQGDNWTGIGNSIAYKYDIDDPTVYGMPSIGAYEIVGEEDQDAYDDTLTFAMIPFQEDTTRAAATTFKGIYNSLQDTLYNYTPHWSADPSGYWQSTLLNQRMSKTGSTTLGLALDPDFKYGYGWQLNGVEQYFMSKTGYSFSPNFAPFIFECEVKFAPSDFANLSSHKTIYAHNGLMYISLYRGYIYVTGTSSAHATSDSRSWGWGDAELAPNVYFRLRVTRDYQNGMRVFMSFSKDGEWVERTAGTKFTSNIKDTKYSQLGRRNRPSDNVSYGGYYNDDSIYTLNGKIGYMRYAIGRSFFKTEEHNFNQKPFGRHLIFGDKIIGLKLDRVGPSYTSTVHNGSWSNLMIYKNTENSAKISGTDYAIKVKGDIPKGQKPAVKIEMSKASQNDVSEVQGYVMNFNKK